MKPAEAKKYQSNFSNCWRRECFVPFSGNGRKICRMCELGKCKEGKLVLNTKGEALKK